MQKILAIAQNTFKEAIRDRILYGFLFFALVLIVFSLVLGQLSIGEQVRVTLDVGLAGISFFSVLMSIFLGISLLHKEIEKRTIYPVLAKPISRAAYLIGKFLGLSATMFVQIALMTLFLIVVLWVQGGSPSFGLLLAIALSVVEMLLVIAMALFFTSFSRPFLSGLFCLGIFAAGRNADLISKLAEVKALAWLEPVVDGATTILPNLYVFYPSGKLVEGSWASVHDQFVSSGYVASAAGYGAAYTAVFLLLSIVLLWRRDFI